MTRWPMDAVANCGDGFRYAYALKFSQDRELGSRHERRRKRKRRPLPCPLHGGH